MSFLVFFFDLFGMRRQLYESDLYLGYFVLRSESLYSYATSK